MSASSSDAKFVGSIPALYESLLVPMIFEEPARALAASIAAVHPHDVLETAAGTGVLTRQLATVPDLAITATDLNAGMVEAAQVRLSSDCVRWQVADAMELPFADASFDVVACQFGAMFFPDKVGGYAEARRVLRPDGSFLFSVWDRIETSPIADIVTKTVAAAGQDESLLFLSRTPHGHFDMAAVERDLRGAGYTDISTEQLSGTSHTNAHDAAVAYCQGTPLRVAIEQSTLDLEHATALAEEALRTQFGAGTFDAPTSWFQVSARSE